MDYFSKFLRGGPTEATATPDYAAEFDKAWVSIKETLSSPDERQITRGIHHTVVPDQLRSMTDALVRESTQYEDATGPCMEYLLKHDVLNALVRLSEMDRPFGIQAEVLRTISNLVVMLDEKFLVHSSIHKAVIRLLQACVGDDIIEPTAGVGKVMGAAGSVTRVSPSEYEEDLVNLLCTLCSRIRTYPELLMIFFHDKNWVHPRMSPRGREEDLSGSEDEEEEEEEEEEGPEGSKDIDHPPPQNDEEATSSGGTDNLSEGSDVVSPERDEDDDYSTDADLSATPTKHTILLASRARDRSAAPSPSSRGAASVDSGPPISSQQQHPHYEFLIFNYLMRFIHREGAIGDFGRTGLLFLLDVAMCAQEMMKAHDDPVSDAATALADYILEGDFAEVLGAGLGAVYSLLPYKLELRRELPETSLKDTTGGGMQLGVVTVGTVDEEKAKADAEERRIQSLGADVSTSKDFRGRLDHFLKLVQFVQDVLKRVELSGTLAEGDTQGATNPESTVTGRAIAFAVLESIRSIFLQNVLYPSILECSDADGSAVAVMSYINTLLQTLPPGPLLGILIEFLMADDDASGDGAPARAKRVAPATKTLRRRSSAMVLLSMEAPHSNSGPSEYFTSLGRFTLKDLLISNIPAGRFGGAGALQTGVAALTLLHTLLTDQCRKCVEGLLNVTTETSAVSPVRSLRMRRRSSASDETDDDSDTEFVYPGGASSKPSRPLADVLHRPDTTVSTQTTEQKMYLNLVRKIDGREMEDGFSTKYDHYLRDAVDNIQLHSCYHREPSNEESETAPLSQSKHRLTPTDPLIKAVLSSLRNFFVHTPEYNVSLTGILVDLSCCPDRSLAGWLTLAPKDDAEADAWAKHNHFGATGGQGEYHYDEDEDDGDDHSVDFAVDQKLRSENPTPAFDFRLRDPKAMPVIYTILSGLVAQLDRYRMVVDDFDSLLKDRKGGLLFSENLNDALSLALDIDTPNATPVRSLVNPQQVTSPAPKAAKKSFVSAFLTPKKKSTPADSDPVTPAKKGSTKDVTASPFAQHYQKTTALDVDAYVAPPPMEGPWSSAGRAPKIAPGLTLDRGGFDDGDVFLTRAPMETVREEGRDEEDEKEPQKVTLSQLLDNVVILEESIKELTAIVQARISLGIDNVRYL